MPNLLEHDLAQIPETGGSWAKMYGHVYVEIVIMSFRTTAIRMRDYSVAHSAKTGGTDMRFYACDHLHSEMPHAFEWP